MRCRVEVAAVDVAQHGVLRGPRRRLEDALLERQQRVVDPDEEEVVADEDVAALEVKRRLVQAEASGLGHLVGDERVAVARERRRLDERAASTPAPASSAMTT